jgi:hypothetical protein
MQDETMVVPSPKRRYVLILICLAEDTWGHNLTFAHEIGSALSEQGYDLRRADYRDSPRDVMDALTDPDCAFALSFNGFGAELAVQPILGVLTSAFRHFGKPLFDLMHDCPSHESMVHGTTLGPDDRHLLITDYGYVRDAEDLGARNVRFVPSITFPKSLPGRPRPFRDRTVEVLLPIGWLTPDAVSARYPAEGGPRSRAMRAVYDEVSERCIGDLALDPRLETRAACKEAGLAFDVRNADGRFLMTTILDRVRFDRRYRLVQVLRRFPVTLLSNHAFDAGEDSRILSAPVRSFRELLTLMSDSRAVICPLPHYTGFHERALGAFTAGAAVIAAPNALLETHFRPGRDMFRYRSEGDLADALADLVRDVDGMEAVAANGRERAMANFPPARLVEAMLNILESKDSLARQAAASVPA